MKLTIFSARKLNLKQLGSYVAGIAIYNFLLVKLIH